MSSELDVGSILRRLYPERSEAVHKGDFGYVLCVGGSEWYSGALIFNALGALRAGADVSYCYGPRRAADAASHHRPDLIGVPFPGRILDEAAVSTLTALTERCDAVVMGSGLEDGEDSRKGIRRAIRRSEKPLVLDATAVSAVGERPDALQGKTALLTPHPGEFERLTGVDVKAPDVDARVEAVRAQAKRLGCTILLKGHVDVVSDGERVHLDREGSPYLTKGGYGDLMAGVAGALIARGATPFEAGAAAAYVVGRAGAQNAAQWGEGALASGAADEIPGVLRRVLGRP